MNYALIKNGVVANIITLLPRNVQEFPNAINIDGLGIQIGDTYEDGRFYRNGEPIFSTDEQLADAMSALATLGYTEE